MTTFRFKKEGCSKLLVLAAVALFAANIGFATLSMASSSAGINASAERVELARQYIASVPVEDEIKAAIDQMANNIQADQRLLFRSIADKSIDYTKLREAAVKSTAEIFTESEIKAMIDFFGSTDGRAIRAKLPQYEAQIQPVLNEVLQAFVLKLQENNVSLAPGANPAAAAQ